MYLIKLFYRSIRIIYYRTILITYKLIFNRAIYGSNIRLNGIPLFKLYGKTSFGSNLIFNSSTIYNMAGIDRRCSIYVGNNAQLEIGENSGFSGVAIYVEKGLVIGKNCLFGANTSIWDTDFHPISFIERRDVHSMETLSEAILIGDDVFVGGHCIILKGIKIGNRSIIGAGSIVNKNIPDDEIWAGNPIKFIRKLNDQ